MKAALVAALLLVVVPAALSLQLADGAVFKNAADFNTTLDNPIVTHVALAHGGVDVLTGAPLGAFSTSTSLRYLMYSYAAYQYSSLQPYLCSYCTYYGPSSSLVVTKTLYDAGTDARGYIGYNTQYQEIVIAFRGSSSIQNWIQNLKIYKSQSAFPGASGGVATGFLQFYQALTGQIYPALNTLRANYPSFSIVTTGHSLGAAAAVLCALDLKVNKGITASIFDFGSPRVGDGTFANFVNSKIASLTRVTHDGDIVVHLPPQAFNFQHSYTEIWEDSGNTYHVCSGSEDGNCANSVPFWDYSVSDHLSYMGVSCCNGPNTLLSMDADADFTIDYPSELADGPSRGLADPRRPRIAVQA